MNERISRMEHLSTKITYVTDMTLLKELKKDNVVSRYSVIRIDDANERTLYSYILIELLSRVVKSMAKMQDPLKLVIMTGSKVENFNTNVVFVQFVLLICSNLILDDCRCLHHQIRSTS
ncbi:putative ATP-dependent RNA helicase DHX37 [Orchesella cincta]|uniref:Putative ATP-dependent RNA helicase DHX37 n=1 Tax=Orchesella cincta TaxID=48709 RepID=A0A1D2M5W3_ORCCI|nr:putative ATP-dependent RNA helicase DHX37 [Orchesella cincta]